MWGIQFGQRRFIGARGREEAAWALAPGMVARWEDRANRRDLVRGGCR
jgi:hypothetical protein